MQVWPKDAQNAIDIPHCNLNVGFSRDGGSRKNRLSLQKRPADRLKNDMPLGQSIKAIVDDSTVQGAKPLLSPSVCRQLATGGPVEFLELAVTFRQQRAELIAAILELGERYPNWRLAQLIANVAGWADQDIWDVEDEQLLAAARLHLQQLPSAETLPAR